MNIKQLIEAEIKNLLNEFKEDIARKAVCITGLPAAGKSSFINQGIKQYIPDFKGYNVTNSDA